MRYIKMYYCIAYIFIFICIKQTKTGREECTYSYKFNISYNENICPIENNNNNWEPISESSSLYFRRPHCLNNNYLYVLQDCDLTTHVSAKTGNTFYSNKDEFCSLSQDNIKYCPNHLMSANTFCYELIPSVGFNDYTCPPNTRNFSWEYLNYINNTETLWFPGKRRSKFGQFLYTDFADEYGTEVVIASRNHEPNHFEENDCLVLLNRKVEPVPCTSKHTRICAYDFLHDNTNSICRRNNIPNEKNCMNANFDHNFNCICANENTYECNYAALINPYQNGIGILKENCKLDLKLDSCIIKWNSTEENIKYSYWSEKYVSDYYNGDSIILMSDGWSFLKNEVNCNICEETVEFPTETPVISLTYEDNIMKLTTDVKGLYGFDGMETIFCLTNGEPDSTIKRFKTVYSFIEIDYFEIEHSGQYWCEAFELKKFEIVTSNVVLVVLHNIYVIEITYKYKEGDDPTAQYGTYSKIVETMTQFNKKSNLNTIWKWAKTMYIDEVNKYSIYLIHICTDITNNHLHDFYFINATLIEFLNELDYVVNSSELYNSKYCIKTETLTPDYVLHWNTTEILKNTTANEICLDYYGKEVQRQCLYDYETGARWGPVEKCFGFSNTTSEITNSLFEVMNSNLSTGEIISNLHNITKESEQFKPIDVYMTSAILINITSSNVNIREVCSSINNVIIANNSILRDSQLKMNATDRILDSFDHILALNKWKFVDELFSAPLLNIFIFDTKLNKYRGLALVNNKPLKLSINLTIEDVIKIPLIEMAALIPDTVLNLINKLIDSKIIIVIHYKDTLFNDPQTSSESKIFGILIPGNNELRKNINLIYKVHDNTDTKFSCSFWNYGENKGSWLEEVIASTIDTNFVLCKYDHVTHFGLLITTRNILQNTAVLDILSGIGSALSIIGILFVFLTGILFPSWRQNCSNKLLLHFSLISLIQTIVLYLSELIKTKNWKAGCITIGAILHYTVLAQFSWMLLLGILQYRRHVVVLYSTEKQFLIKLYLFGYIFPACPVLIVLLFFTSNYNHSNIGLCYPTGDAFNYAVLMPAMCIFIINLIIFTRIMYELFCKNNNQVESNDVLLRIRLAFLMFFILGITWLFGFLSFLFDNTIFLYIFNITVSLQGFVIFVFFVALNKNTRIMYLFLWNKYSFHK